MPSAVDAAKRACFAGIRESSVLPSKGRPDKNKGERKEVCSLYLQREDSLLLYPFWAP